MTPHKKDPILWDGHPARPDIIRRLFVTAPQEILGYFFICKSLIILSYRNAHRRLVLVGNAHPTDNPKIRQAPYLYL